ncbi:MAG: BrnA antitoxin family protein [Treponema sp.]|jgi:predicted DNA binding CopG/RHH family protein|nr:BrnA antitoxin family protein [Treponema sp.]
MKISEYLEPDIGEKGETDMNKKIIYTNAPKNVSKSIADGEIIADFLPPPEQLVRKEPKIKVTITLNSKSVDFFKRSAERNNVKYQTMINNVLDLYVQKYKDRIKV